jgi:hypothetical protein
VRGGGPARNFLEYHVRRIQFDVPDKECENIPREIELK